MENKFEREQREEFRISRQEWLQTLLAIAGDKEKKAEIVQRVARETGCPPTSVEGLMNTTIKILMNETRSN